MSPYEILYIINGEISEEEQAKITSALEALVSEAEGKILSTENLGKKKLAYPIKKIKTGYYLLSRFELPPLKLKELEKKIKLTSEILRFLILKKELVSVPPEKPKKPLSPVFKKEAPVFKKEEAKKPEKKEKVSTEELDAKLDEILGDDIAEK